jgi:hypothetical protein
VIETNGLDVLLAWCGFAVLVGVLAWLLLRHRASPGAEARHCDESLDENQHMNQDEDQTRPT